MTIDNFYTTYGNNASVNLGACVVDQKAFFKDPRGLLWKQAMDSYIQNHPEIRFNKGMFKEHILALALEYHRDPAQVEDIGTFIERKTAPGQFALKQGDPGYNEEVVESVAFAVFRTLVVIFLNVITLGLVSLLWIRKNAGRIECLSDEAAALKEFKAEQKKRLGLAAPHLERIVKESEAINTSVETTHNEIETLRTEKKQIKGIDRANLKILKLLHDKENVEDLVKDASLAKKEQQLAGNTYTGFVDPLYMRKESDKGSIDPKYRDIDKPKKNEQGDYIVDEEGDWVTEKVLSEIGKRVNNRQTMEELLDSVFDWAIEELAKKTPKENIQLENEECRLSLCKYMVYLMIDTAGVETPCGDKTASHLLLNKYNETDHITVDTSVAFRAKKRDGSGYETLYKNWDGFTPVDSSKFPRGVDPLAVKWILTRNEKDNAVTEELLLKTFLKKEGDVPANEEIILADQLIEDIARALMERYQPLFDRKVNAFAAASASDSSSESSSPSVEESRKSTSGESPSSLDASVKNSSKSSSSSQDATESSSTKSESASSISIVEDPIVTEVKEEAKTWISPELNETLKKSWDILKVLAKRKDLVGGEDFQINLHNDGKLLNQVRTYFDMIHLNINISETTHHGSFFSALTFLLTQGATDKAEINPMLIRTSMANYLELNKDAWKERVEINTKKVVGAKSEGYTVDQYISWLKGEKLELNQNQVERKNEDPNDLEIELAAFTFGIQIHLLVKGKALTRKEGVYETEAALSFGPKTEEKLYLLSTLEVPAYRALSPKLKDAEDEDAKKVIAEHNRFFVKNGDQKLRVFGKHWNNFTV